MRHAYVPRRIDTADRGGRARQETSMIRLSAAIGLAMSAAACMPTAVRPHLAGPADPALPVRDPAYASVVRGVANYEVTGPKDWIEQNRQVAPGGAPRLPSTNRTRRSR
jgi:hypothetical protein